MDEQQKDDFPSQDKKVISAGILWYSVVPGSDKVFFLLGKEVNEMAPQLKKYEMAPLLKKCWCEFGGKMEEGEEEEEAAVREAFEESLGVLYFGKDKSSSLLSGGLESIRPQMNNLISSLKSGRYTFKIKMCLNFGASPEIPRRYHVTFVKQIPWNPAISFEFACLREKLFLLSTHSERVLKYIRELVDLYEEIDHDEPFVYPCPIPGYKMYKSRMDSIVEKSLANQQQIIDSPIFYSSEMDFFKDRDIDLYDNNDSDTFMIDPIVKITQLSDVNVVVPNVYFTIDAEYLYLENIDPNHIHHLLTASENSSNNSSTNKIIDTNNSSAHTTASDNQISTTGDFDYPLLLLKREKLILRLGLEESGLYLKFLLAQRDLYNFYYSLPVEYRNHPAIYVNENGVICVRHEFLEKEYILYWSIERLAETLFNGGIYKRELLRPSFIPTMAVVVDLFKTCMKRYCNSIGYGHYDTNIYNLLCHREHSNHEDDENNEEDDYNPDKLHTRYLIYCNPKGN